MIEEACVAIERVTEQDRVEQASKYARRNKMRYIDQLLNELEMLNLAEQREMPRPLATALDELIAESEVVAEAAPPGTVIEAMDVLYEIQDSLMFTQIEDE